MQFWENILYIFYYKWCGSFFNNIIIVFKINHIFLWQAVYLGFFFDELFAVFIDIFLRRFFLLPALFIFDRWFIIISGTLLVKNILYWFNKYIFIYRITIINIVIFSFILFFLAFLILIYGAKII